MREPNIHQQVMEVVRVFLENRPTSDSYFQKIGTRPPERERTREQDMKDVYQALSDGDGAPVYLEGGVWLRPDGTFE